MALWRSRVRAPLGPPSFFLQGTSHHQSEWYREAPFVSERKGLFFIDDFGLTIDDRQSSIVNRKS